MASKQRNDFRTSERATRLHLQTGAQLWAELIRLTGGNIAFHKCAWQMLAFEAWTFPPTIKERPTGQVRLHDAAGHYSTIRKMASNTPNKGLGCHQSVDGSMDKEYKYREEQCRQLASRAQLTHTTFRESHSLLMNYMIPSITHPMAGTTFNTTQCKDLNIILDRVMLNKLHVNRNMPRAVVYSPTQFAGMNYPSIQIIQDQQGILTMLQHFRWNDTLGTDMLVVLSAIQLVSGLCDPILEDVDSNLSYIPFGWFIHQRGRLKEMNGKLWVEHQWTPSIQRDHNQSLMSVFLSIPDVTPIKLRHSNYCRLFMRVITVADMANIKGNSVPGDRMDGKWQSTSNLQWPQLTCRKTRGKPSRCKKEETSKSVPITFRKLPEVFGNSEPNWVFSRLAEINDDHRFVSTYRPKEKV